MFRFSSRFLITATEATAFLSTTAPKALATDDTAQRQKLVPTLMEIFGDHTKDSTLVSQSAQLMTAIDQEASDSFTIAQHSESLRVIIETVMKQNVHNVEVKEHCCRAIANVCMLPNDTFEILNGRAPTPSSSTDGSSAKTAEENALPKSFADVAVDLGAVEVVVGCMSHVSRLSEKGRCWVATALQNLLMFATTPSATLRAGKAGAEDVLSTFLVELCHDASAAMSDLQSEVRRAGGNTEAEAVQQVAVTLQRMLIALDAATATLARLMNAPFEENMNHIDTRAQVASATVIDAAIRSMMTALGITTVLTKLQTNDLKSLSFSNIQFAEARDEAALPILHKGWEVIKAIAAHKNNLPVIFNAIDEVNSEFQSLFARNEPWVKAAAAAAPHKDGSVAASVAAATANVTAHKIVVEHVLEILVNHTMLQVAPTVSANATLENGAENVPRLAFDAAVGAITDLTATRADVSAADAEAANEQQTSATSSSSNNNAEEESDIPMAQVMDGDNDAFGTVSRSVPTEAAATAISCLTNGIAANTAVAHLPRQWQSLVKMATDQKPIKTTNLTKDLDDKTKARLHVQYNTVHDACGYFGMLANLADAGDAYAASPNAVAVAAQCLNDYLSIAQSAHFKFASNATFNASSSGASATVAPSQILLGNLEAQHYEIVAMQRLLIPVIGKAFTMLWNAVGTPKGMDAVRTMEVAQTVAAINKNTSMLLSTLNTRQNELVTEQLEAYNKDEASSSTPPPATPSAIIDGFSELERVGNQLYQKLDAIVVNPVYAQNKHAQK